MLKFPILRKQAHQHNNLIMCLLDHQCIKYKLLYFNYGFNIYNLIIVNVFYVQHRPAVQIPSKFGRKLQLRGIICVLTLCLENLSVQIPLLTLCLGNQSVQIPFLTNAQHLGVCRYNRKNVLDLFIQLETSCVWNKPLYFNDLFDVTLACDDSGIQTHNLILYKLQLLKCLTAFSKCSPALSDSSALT